MNIWAVNKTEDIKKLLIMLTSQLGKEAFDISERWQTDLSAVGLCKRGDPSLVAYIYTHGQEPDKYGVHLLFPELPDVNTRGIIDAKENVTFEQLLDIVAIHLDIVV
ncbi:hypothetical protein [Beggiatoa leptomitoformis]|uniref:Uncharacterized protein n=1 Tax=Beggiatoa leptomitoformis TaxID=288004 RepID=A0A2N9YCJ5_9GAMM|nr:hypothetical protein [Beggiatoa leptomitoformis]ALG66523.1 hypothetical protein AL038_00695 [Beggiatoa leptomitoformis]AUI68180.1 hypothetical protein BLE401_05350 [Beggiatoa leptomitoformis]